jgi:hypothetical protein
MKNGPKTVMWLLISWLICLSGGSFCGAVQDETAWISSGRLGGAVSLSGDHCLSGWDVGELDRMTLSMWIKPLTQKQSETSIFSCFNWKEGAVHWLLGNDGHLNLCIKGCDPEELRSQGRLRHNAWNHIALVYDRRGGSAGLFLNGKQDQRTSYRDVLTLELYDFCVGA